MNKSLCFWIDCDEMESDGGQDPASPGHQEAGGGRPGPGGAGGADGHGLPWPGAGGEADLPRGWTSRCHKNRY